MGLILILKDLSPKEQWKMPKPMESTFMLVCRIWEMETVCLRVLLTALTQEGYSKKVLKKHQMNAAKFGWKKLKTLHTMNGMAVYQGLNGRQNGLS